MTTTSKTAKSTALDAGAVEEGVARIRDLNETLIDSAKQAGQASLDAYEHALQSLVDFQSKIAGDSQIEWVSTLANMQAKFVQDISGFYVNAMRDILK
ncbi:hypothetical protein [[Mycobacterium] crassicus]|uniref:Uncharacterized protein n=1 Tax=[Mycobacterium] crassicus TaxID=2872309 RepID=A0ABU5XIL1_9MYCO|nr:hypothetical protein [Mycolicibacter sp. MYC098]MEB3022132.1 hypothetical protein [Mycolicibacter sp. MYC098]